MSLWDGLDTDYNCQVSTNDDHEMVEFRILRGGSRAISRIKTLDLRSANFALFRELLGGIPFCDDEKSNMILPSRLLCIEPFGNSSRLLIVIIDKRVCLPVSVSDYQYIMGMR